MAKPLRNPFYWLLILTCGSLLVTMLTYLVGWGAIPNPDAPGTEFKLPPFMKWIDRNALWLISGEVGLLVLFAVLTISLDAYFEPNNATTPGSNEKGRHDDKVI